ncbi:hypothetical protein M9458_033316, partial [Cirrhinus mrigala]
EVDVETVDEVSAPQFPQYEELLEVVTRAVAKLNIDWPAEPQVEPQKSKPDERFLRSRPPSARRSLPFFPDLHTEVSRTWNEPFSSRLFIPASYNYGCVAGLHERGYRAMPRVEQTLASYLSPVLASSLKAPVLPSKPLRVTSALVGKGYTAAGQAGACLHTMSVLQAYQADLLKELDEGDEVRDSDISELRRTADLSLRATKETACAIGRSMAALVAAERHLWLTLSDMKEKDRVFLLNSPLSPSGLFGDAVNTVVERDREARKQAAAFQRFLPRRTPAQGAAGREQPRPSTSSSSYRETQKQSVATRTPPQRERVVKRSNPTCRSCYSRRSPRLSGPDNSGPLRAAPSGERRGAPHYSVSALPPCPQEAGLLTLQGIQGAAASSKHPPQSLPPSDVAELGSSLPPRGSLGPLVQVLPAGLPLQDTVLAAHITPEASLERLVPLVDHLAAWKLLPNVSAWVLHTVERGYRIQLGAPPPPFNGVSPTLVGPEQGLVMEQEVATLLRKEAIEVVPPHDRESGFYSRYFIVPKKDGGLRPILDLRLLNRSVMRLKFKMLTIKQVVSQIRSEDWFVTIDLKDAYFHVSILPQHRKFLRFAFRGKAYQYRVLPFGLALSPRTFTKCVDAALAPLRLLESSRESVPGWGVPPSSSPILAGPSMVLGPDLSPRRLSLGDSRQERSPLTGRGFHPSPPAGAVEALGVASEGAHLLASGLSTEVVETILQSRASSTRKLYALKWKLFTSWCGRHQQDPVNCPVGSVLEFLQDRLSAGLTHSPLKVYVAAIAAYHAPLGGLSVGKNPLVTRFLRGALRLRPPVRPRVPSWDLSVVLEALCLPPFEPIEEISDRHLSIKTVLLLALSSLKRVGDLQALSVAPSFLDFAPGLSKAFLYPRAGYIPKVPSSAPRPVVLQAFCPPPFRDPDQQKLNCMCPVRALDTQTNSLCVMVPPRKVFLRPSKL